MIAMTTTTTTSNMRAISPTTIPVTVPALEATPPTFTTGGFAQPLLEGHGQREESSAHSGTMTRFN